MLDSAKLLVILANLATGVNLCLPQHIVVFLEIGVRLLHARTALNLRLTPRVRRLYFQDISD